MIATSDPAFTVHQGTTNVGNHVLGIDSHRMRVYRKFRLEAERSGTQMTKGGTYVEDMEDPVEVHLPGRNGIFVVLRERVTGAFTQLLDVPLDHGHRPAIQGMMNKQHKIWCSLRRQLINGSEYGWTELDGLSLIYSSVESCAYISAGQA